MSGTLIRSPISAQSDSQRRANVRRAIAVCVFLVLAVLLVFGRTLGHGFSNSDDPYFVFAEPHVTGGLSWPAIVWAFTEGPFGDWYPLTMLSHMLDCQLFGLRPAWHHLTNVLLHAATAVTLFLVLRRMTGALWPSAMVAALFALHPLRVESVAWVSERRDVLSGFFFMLTLGAYAEYVRYPRSLARYLAVVGFFALGLMAKPSLVTVPPLLLLLDFWPLARFDRKPPGPAAANMPRAVFPWRVIIEKLPLFAMSAAVAVITMLTQNPWQPSLTFLERLANGAVSYVAYLGQLFVPLGLSPFYSHPEAGRPAWEIAAAVAIVSTITAAAVIGRRSYPYFFVGWFWYVGMLVPVLGLAQAFAHAHADRYTYLAQIGLDIALVWGAMRLGASWPARRRVFAIGSALILMTLMACSWRQSGFWRDDQTLWEHALECDPHAVRAHYMLGFTLEATDADRAAAEYRQALKLGPNERNIYRKVRTEAHSGLANIAAQQGDVAGAVAQCQQALESDPSFVMAHMNLGTFLAQQGKFDQAKIHFQRGMELEPTNATCACCLAVTLAQQGKTEEAIEVFRKALKADPNSGIAHLRLAVLLAEQSQVDEAIVHLRRAIEIDPNGFDTYHRLAQLLRGQGKLSEADQWDVRGAGARHRHADARTQSGVELVQQGRTDEAIAQFEMAVALVPDNALAHCHLAGALESRGNRADAIAHYRRALEIDPNLVPAKVGLRQISSR